MNSVLKSFLTILIFTICAGVSYGVYQYSSLITQEEEAVRERPPQAVEVTSLSQSHISDQIQLVGTLEPAAEVNIRPKTPGYIMSLPFDIGDHVNSGEVAVKLDPSHAQEAYLQAQSTKVVREKERDASQIQLNLAENKLKRVERLRDRGAVTEQEWEEAESQRDVAKANFDLQVAMVAQATSTMKSAELLKDECSMTSPVSGVVAERMADIGDLADPSTVIIRIIKLESVYTVVNIVERDYSKIRQEQTAKIEVDAYPGKVFNGHVRRIAPQIDLETRTAAIQIEIDNAEGYLKPGMYARVTLVCEEKEDADTIPLFTVMQDKDTSYVYVADRKTSIVRQQSIQTGIVDGEVVEVKSGLASGDRVITLGNRLVKVGDTVTVVNEEPANYKDPGREYAVQESVDVQAAE